MNKILRKKNVEVLQVPTQDLNFEIYIYYKKRGGRRKHSVICADLLDVLKYYSLGAKIVKESQKSLSLVYILTSKEGNNLPQKGRFLLTKVLYEGTTERSRCYTEQQYPYTKWGGCRKVIPKFLFILSF